MAIIDLCKQLSLNVDQLTSEHFKLGSFTKLINLKKYQFKNIIELFKSKMQSKIQNLP
jgi:hypothetical protein